MKPRRMALNVACLFPHVLGPLGPSRAVEMALQAGYSELQLLPLRGWTERTISYIPQPLVVSYEGAWNSGQLWQAFARMAHLAGDEYPTLADVVYFGRKPLNVHQIASVFPKALSIVHDQRLSGLYEISPEGGMPKGNRDVVVDTHHIRRPRRDGSKSPLPSWKEVLAWVWYKIGVIHAHPAINETRGLLEGRRSELTDMLQMLGRMMPPQVPVVVELAPLITSTRSGLIRHLSEVREVVEEWMSG